MDGDWSDEYLDTQEVTDALHIIKNNLTKPNEEDIQNFYKFIASSSGFIRPKATPLNSSRNLFIFTTINLLILLSNKSNS
ncbi:hypothetical protein P4K10_23460 [Bacillus anthracis]|uniref:hypothetical protein n=1 Tax=Bacillus anthracis TaxID=1392 RepID=UPI002DB68DCB|nr:hypothetical protein [Bacillus anthracis]MEB9630936.1 hypothetical protein [Bacillus anthracis]